MLGAGLYAFMDHARKIIAVVKEARPKQAMTIS
jgi:hypothetical protein